MTLFASQFLVKPLDAAPDPEGLSYDEARGVTVDAVGRPLVELAEDRRMRTLTEVRGEAAEPDEDDDWCIDGATHTKIGSEKPDQPKASHLLGTETRSPEDPRGLPPKEADHMFGDDEDYPALLDFETKTAVQGERDLWPVEGMLETQTFVQTERPDADDALAFEAEMRLGTETAVGPEHPDR